MIIIDSLSSRCIAAEELEKDEVSNEAIENACRKLREIKGVEPRKRNENVRRRPISDFSALANRIGVDVGGLTDGIEQGLTEGQTFVQALQVTELVEGESRKIHAIEIDENSSLVYRSRSDLTLQPIQTTQSLLFRILDPFLVSLWQYLWRRETEI